MGSSQVLRWLDQLNGVGDSDARAVEIRKQIKRLRSSETTSATKREIRKLYAMLDSVQFKPDYLCLVIDREKDYIRACKGFSVNGLSYSRLLGTAGGIKNSTIVFVSDRHKAELVKRIDNGRDLSKPIVPAKLEAYKALTCSASTPVSFPNGILVVKDVETTFHADTIYLDDATGGEPTMEFRPDTEITMDASDGFGLMLPSLAERWSDELKLGYTTCAVCCRAPFLKGMAFTFDFVDFADNVAHKSVVKDVWGHDVDIHNVEAIFTESMLKLWDSYSGVGSYLENCLENDYTFGITKAAPEELENVRALNYQFIQGFRLSDKDIDELSSQTENEIEDVLCGDWRKTVLFLRGSGITESNADKFEDGFIKAMMIDRRVADDPFVQSSIYQLIKGRINEAKIGVLDVHGNYSIISGDPYSLCQSVFGLPITGILKAGEIYNKYWLDDDAEHLVCFRAPMSTHENVRAVTVNRSDEAAYWYRYMNVCTILNSWDTITAALNGADMDGDIVMLTDNKVLVDRHEPMPAIMCVQKKAEKIIPTEEDIVKSNIASFGNEIGSITNRTTSMYEVMSHFKSGSKEIETLIYRIRCGQLMQQNSIDKTKGIVSKPMPRNWYDLHAIYKMEDDAEREFYKRIAADRKPYFMRYIYPDLMKQYNTYMTNANKNALREFGKSIAELEALPVSGLTDQQVEFMDYYRRKMPVGTGDCVMNIICRKFEDKFDGYVGRAAKNSNFDYTFMKSGTEYTQTQFYQIKKLYDEYNRKTQSYVVQSRVERIDAEERKSKFLLLQDEFRKECSLVCPNSKQLCDLLLDLCYKRTKSKAFVWEMCADQIIENLLLKNNRKISYPTLSDDGEIEYAGNHYTIRSKEILDIDADYIE